MSRTLLVFAVAIVFIIYQINPIISAIKANQKEKEKEIILKEKVDEQKKIKEKLEYEVEQISKDENIERIAREKLNMSSKNERVYKFVEEDKQETEAGEK